MNNPAEEIVCTWAQLCKNQFVMTNIPYQYTTKSGKSVTREIDLFAASTSNTFFDYEVKWRTTRWINATDAERIDNIAEQLVNPYRNKIISELVQQFSPSKIRFIQKILVTPMKYFGKDTLEERKKELKKKGVEIIWFEDVLKELLDYIEKSPNKGQFDSSALGAIRILKELSAEIGL